VPKLNTFACSDLSFDLCLSWKLHLHFPTITNSTDSSDGEMVIRWCHERWIRRVNDSSCCWSFGRRILFAMTGAITWVFLPLNILFCLPIHFSNNNFLYSILLPYYASTQWESILPRISTSNLICVLHKSIFNFHQALKLWALTCYSFNLLHFGSAHPPRARLTQPRSYYDSATT
jgi:hypothetical protein